MIADAPHSALDRDTRLLSELLEETIAGQGGEGLRNAVVRLREAGSRVRAGQAGAEEDAAARVRARRGAAAARVDGRGGRAPGRTLVEGRGARARRPAARPHADRPPD